MDEIISSEGIRQIAGAFQASRILLTAFELQLFTILEHHMLSPADAAGKLNADPRGVDRLMNALCGIGLLKKVKGKFYNSDVASKYLVEGKPDFMGNLYHTNHLWDTWSCLTESVIQGGSYKGDQNKSGKKEWVEAFIRAMHHRGVQQGKILSMMIDLSGVKKMLDVGGGSAAFSIEIVKKEKAVNVVIFDLPHVIPLTRNYVKAEALEEKFTFIEGNYLSDGFGYGYDLILLSAIVHINSYEQNKSLINKCSDALNKNGRIIINDFVMNNDRTKPVHGAVFALNMLVGTEYGDTYTEDEMREWFAAAGINKIERKNTSYGSDLMIGTKF